MSFDGGAGGADRGEHAAGIRRTGKTGRAVRSRFRGGHTRIRFHSCQASSLRNRSPSRPLALAAFAFITAIRALLTWYSQADGIRDQAELLKLQVAEFRQAAAEREREALQRRKVQAAQVYGWTTREQVLGFDALLVQSAFRTASTASCSR